MRADGQSSWANYGWLWLDVGRRWLPVWLPTPLAPLTFSVLAAACQTPAPIRAADVARLTLVARPIAGDHDRGRRVTGSMTVPAMHPKPITQRPGEGAYPPGSSMPPA